MFEKIRQLPARFQRDERGQAMVITVILAIVLVRSVMMSFNTGVAVSERIRTQIVADMAAFSGATWQARFLNYCAYSRRAILANYASISLLNAMIVNKWAVLDHIYDAEEFNILPAWTDTGLVTDMMEFHKTVLDIIIPYDDDNAFRNVMTFQGGQTIADHMSVLLSLSQEGLWLAISPIEWTVHQAIVTDCNNVPGKGQLVLANIVNHTVANNIFAGVSVPPAIAGSGLLALTIPLNANIGFRGGLGLPELPLIGQIGTPILRQSRLSGADGNPGYGVPEVRNLLDDGMTNISLLPPHLGMNMPPFLGRPWIGFHIPDLNPCDTQYTQFVTTIPRNSTLTQTRITSDEALLGNFFFAWWQLFLCKFDTPWGPIIIGVGWPVVLDMPDPLDYDFLWEISRLRVYEMRNNLQRHEYEPSVYAAVACRKDTMPYFRIRPSANVVRDFGLLERVEDIVALSRAKVTFSTPNETTNNAFTRNTQYPYNRARMARIKDGENGSLLFFATRRSIFSIKTVLDVLGISPMY